MAITHQKAARGLLAVLDDTGRVSVQYLGTEPTVEKIATSGQAQNNIAEMQDELKMLRAKIASSSYIYIFFHSNFFSKIC